MCIFATHKILGNESIDIDVALDTVTGVAFCKALQRYFASIPEDQSPISTNIGAGIARRDQSLHAVLLINFCVLKEQQSLTQSNPST
jgi:hypothetical protein